MTSASRSSGSWSQATATAGWLGPWLGVAALGLWAGTPGDTSGSAALAAAAAGVVASAFWGRRSGVAWSAGLAVLLAGILAGFAAHRQVRALETNWGAYWASRESRVGEQLNRALNRRLEAGEAAVDALAAKAGNASFLQDPSAIEDLRTDHGVSAVALYDAQGNLVAWDGSHHGQVPADVRLGRRRYAYSDLPLFGYLYVTAPAGNGTAMAALLLRSDLPWETDADADDFATQFRRTVGEGIRILHGPVPEGTTGWDLHVGDQVLFTVVPDQPVQAARIAETSSRWRVIVAITAFVAWLLLAVGGPTRLAAASAAALTLILLGGTVPLERVRVLAPLFDRSLYSAPGPLPIPLGRLALLVLAAVTAVAVAPRPRLRAPAWLTGALAALVLPPLIFWLHQGAIRGDLADGQLPWIVYQGIVTLVVTLVIGTLLAMARGARGRRTLAGAGLLLALVLGFAAVAFVWMQGAMPVWWPALWGLPVAIVTAALGGWRGWRRPLTAWTLACALAGSVALPAAWSDRVDARMTRAAERLHEIGASQKPAIERALYVLPISFGPPGGRVASPPSDNLSGSRSGRPRGSRDRSYASV